MDDLRVNVGSWWLAVVAAAVGLGIALWLFANADEAYNAIPTTEDRLILVAEQYPDDLDLLVVPREPPAEWREPGVEWQTRDGRLTRFELRFLRRFEDPESEGRFEQVRVHLCTSRAPDGCDDVRTVVTSSRQNGITTTVLLDDDAWLDEVRDAWDGVEFTSDWQSLTWPRTRR